MDTEDSRKTSWNDDELLRLCDPSNHRIYFDGYEYHWEHQIYGNWETQFSNEFDTYAKPHSYLIFWLHSWKKEYDNRAAKRRRIGMSKLRRAEKIGEKVAEILSNHSSSIKDKIIKLIKILPPDRTEDLANLLQVSRRTIKRYLKDQ